jgi:hypothetical protein
MEAPGDRMSRKDVIENSAEKLQSMHKMEPQRQRSASFLQKYKKIQFNKTYIKVMTGE